MQRFAVDAIKSRTNLRLSGCFALFFTLGALFFAPAVRGQTLYWDTNGTTAGAGATPTGNWTGTNWTTNVGGTAATTTFTSGRDTVFSAGTDATNAFTVTVTGTQNVSSISIEEGTPTFTGGTINFNDATPNFNVATGLVATVNSLVSGTNGLIKGGTGTLQLGGINTFTGTTTVNAGSLRVAADNNLSASNGALTLNGGTLETTANLTLGATRVFTVGASGGTLDVNGGTTLTYNGAIAGTGTLTKNGTGTFVTGGTAFNSTTGPLVVNAGVFEVAKNGFVGAIDNAAAVTVNTGATLRFNGSATYTQETIGSLSGGGTVTNVGAAPIVFIVGGDNTSTSFSGTITDTTNALSIQKTGTGTFTLSGANSYDGTTTVSAGVLNIQNDSALGTATGGTTVATGAALEIQNNITVTGETLSLSGTGVGGNGALRNISGANTWTGAVTLAAASRIQSDAGTLSVSGNVSSANLGLTVGGAGNTTLSGVVGLGSGSLTKTDAGTLTLSGTAANTYTGGTAINAGTVNLGKSDNVNAVGTGAVTVGDGTGAASSANLVLLANNQTSAASAVTINADGRLALNDKTTSVNTIAGTGLVDLGSTGHLIIGANGGSSVFGGSITGTGLLDKVGNTSLTFNSTINFAGSLTLSGGSLTLNGISATIGSLNITANSTIDFTGASTLNLTNLTIASGVTLTVSNWTNATDFFYAANWTNATLDLSGPVPMSQIVFNGFTPANTKWQSYDHQVTPVPEPSTYGALLLGLAGAGLAWQRRSRSR